MTTPTKDTEETRQTGEADEADETDETDEGGGPAGVGPADDHLPGLLPGPLAEALELAGAVIASPSQPGSGPDQVDPGRIDPEATGPVEAGLPVGLDVHVREHSRQVRGTGDHPGGEAATGQDDPLEQVMVDGVQAFLLSERWAQAQQLAMARALAVRAGAILLARADADDPQQLTPSARRRWRAQTKSVVANELATATGLGIQECHDRVGIALAPPAVVRPALTALEQGRADFRQVRTFWQRARHLRPPHALAVCQAVFAPTQTDRPLTATDADEEQEEGPYPPSGHWRPRSWEEFRQDLDREITRAEGKQVQATRRRRAQRLEIRDASAVIEDAGIGMLTVEGRATSVTAAIARIDKAARRLRQLGDPRPLHQLRAPTSPSPCSSTASCPTWPAHRPTTTPEPTPERATAKAATCPAPPCTQPVTSSSSWATEPRRSCTPSRPPSCRSSSRWTR